MTSPSLPVAGPSQHPKALALSPLQPYFPEPHSSLKRPSKRRTLPEAAKAILSNYYASVSENPNLDERKELLPQIISIPGAEWYTLVHIKKWFASRKCNRFGAKRHESRHRDEEEQSRVSISETDKILWPSLTASKIDKLAILLRETPKPSVTHLQVWGRSLDAQLSHLQNWVELNQAQSKHISTKHVLHPRHPESEHALKPHTIPTPESTASPEPPNSKPYSTSPSIGPTILYQQTYSNYGVPAHVGSSGTLPHHSQAFASVQPSATVSHTLPNTPTSPPTPSPFSPVVPPQTAHPQTNASFASFTTSSISTATAVARSRLPPNIPTPPVVRQQQKAQPSLTEGSSSTRAPSVSVTDRSDSPKVLLPKPFQESHTVPNKPASPTPSSHVSPYAQLRHFPTQSSTAHSAESGMPAPAIGVRLRFSSPIAPTDIPPTVWQKKRGRRDSAGSSAPVLPIAAHSSSPRASEAQPFANTTPVALALAPAVEVTPVAVLPPCLPPSTTSTSAQPPSTQRLLYKAIQKKWAELQSKPPSPPPQTFLELERRLDPVMKFHDALERGDYAPMGFVPSTRYRGEGEVEDDDDELMDLDDE